ncbi:hypothetical protein MOF14_12470 [Bacillus spizizenii]|uniref:hypothetical protein n=1 Tax=Bacillus halotolerans TaxID=260554 RepID=UPI00227F884C|nr:hypothetical protein [Bacillus halotolerans]MCY9367547.1 hypothetical protein [Bacillus spizizenii]WJE41208.1 hypothetical protein QRD86_00195 [Bacillus halotolerans]
MYIIFACIFCLLSLVFKKLKHVFILMAAMLVIFAFCTGEVASSFHKWSSSFSDFIHFIELKINQQHKDFIGLRNQIFIIIVIGVLTHLFVVYFRIKNKNSKESGEEKHGEEHKEN